jgi:hypothetical protein
MISADPAILSSAEQQISFAPDEAVGVVGFTSPFTSPFGTSASVTGAGVAVNAGDRPTWPRFRIDGPITRPIILNNTTGFQIAFASDLLAGEYLLIDAQRASVLLDGVADRYGQYDFASSNWWQLAPGATTSGCSRRRTTPARVPCSPSTGTTPGSDRMLTETAFIDGHDYTFQQLRRVLRLPAVQEGVLAAGDYKVSPAPG